MSLSGIKGETAGSLVSGQHLLEHLIKLAFPVTGNAILHWCAFACPLCTDRGNEFPEENPDEVWVSKALKKPMPLIC